MKKIKLIFLSLIVIGNVLCHTVNAQTSKVAEIQNLLKLAKKDSIQKIERLAALKFHKIINDYRKKNKLDILAWDDAFWLTCRNHCIWMSANSVLSHDEKAGTKYFTGYDPDDRYKYATLGKGKSQWCGENALYNYDIKGKTIMQIASNIALCSFNQWKHSPGHNQNMLEKDSKVHGVAFHLERTGIVYSTDLFARNIDTELNYKDTIIVKEDLTHIATIREVLKGMITIFDTVHLTPIASIPIQTHIEVEKLVKLDVKKVKSDLVNKLYSMNIPFSNYYAKRNNAMEKASTLHSEYMGSTKQLTHDESKKKRKYYGEDIDSRMVKATHGFYLLKKHKYKLIESIAKIEVNACNLDIQQLGLDIQNQLDKEPKLSANKIDIGYGVYLKRNKNNLTFYITRLIGYKRS
jgi:uncharacterized protein YkwD